MTAQQPADFTAGERVTCEATLFKPEPTEKIGSGILLMLPQDVSAKLPSRGMTVVKGTINGCAGRLLHPARIPSSRGR